MDLPSDPDVVPPSRGQKTTSSLMSSAAAKPSMDYTTGFVPGRPSAPSILAGGRRQWWNLCFVYGDQTKYYRQLYGKRTPIRRLQHLKQQQAQQDGKCLKCGGSFGNPGKLQ